MLLSKENRKIVEMCRDFSRWFQVKIEIRVFGKLVWSYVWPPIEKSINDNKDDTVGFKQA